MTIYDKNIAALQKVDSELANKISAIETNERYEVFAQGHFADANIFDKDTNEFLYNKRPIDEIEERYLALKKQYRLYKMLYIYGIGNGHLVNMLLQNPFHMFIYVFEPEIEILYIALNLSDFSEAITDGRLVLIHTKDFNSVKFRNIVDGLAVVHFKAYTLELHNNFYEKYIDDITYVNQEVIKIFRYYAYSTGNSAQDELIGLTNFLKHLPIMLKNATLREMQEHGANTKTAIIVATGPSLTKQLPLLKEIQKYVSIISVDASLPILEKAGIKPDIVTSLERVPATAKFYEKTSEEFQKDILFAPTVIADEKLFENIKGEELQLSMRPTGWHYSYLELDDWGYVGLGMSAANMAYEMASRMDFKEIIIIGQDLAYGDGGLSHSRDHIFGEDEVKVSLTDEYTTAYGGEGRVRTTKVWKMFLEGYHESVAQTNKEGKIVTINATEGGAYIKGTKEMSFSQAIAEYVDKEYAKEKITLAKPTQEMYIKSLKQANEKLTKAIEMAHDMHKRMRKLLKMLTKIIRKYKQYDIKLIHRYATEKETRKLVDKTAEVRNKYYKGEFRTFYESLISPLLTHLEYDIAYWSIQTEDTQKDRIHKNWQMIVFHHEWAYRIMVNIDAILEVLEPGNARIEEILKKSTIIIKGENLNQTPN